MKNRCRFCRVSELWIDRIQEGETWLLGFLPAHLDIDVVWDAIGYLLYEYSPGNDALKSLFWSEDYLFSVENGVERDSWAILSAEEVEEISTELSKIDEAKWIAGLIPENINKYVRLGAPWLGTDEERAQLLEGFRAIREFVAGAAHGQHCILRDLSR